MIQQELGSGLRAAGLKEIHFSSTWPPALMLPEGGLALDDLGDFAEDVLVSGLGYKGAKYYLDPFFNAIPHLNGVVLTRFEVDLENCEGSAPFFIGFQLRESWQIISGSGLPGVPVLAISNPGFTIGSLGGPGSGYLVNVYGTLEMCGAALKVMVEWPSMIITGSLARVLKLQDLLAATGFEKQVALAGGSVGALPEVRALMLRFDLSQKAFAFKFVLDGWQIVPGRLALENLQLDLATSPEHSQASARAQIVVCGVDIDLAGIFQDGQLELSGSTGCGQQIKINQLIRELGKTFGDFQPPASIDDLHIQNLGVSYNTGSKNFTFTAELLFPVDHQDLDMLLSIAIKRQQDGTYTKTFSGRVMVDGLAFEVVFENASGSATFIAAYSDPQGHPVKVQDLVNRISPGTGDCIGSLQFTIKDALLAYQRIQTPLNEKYLFGIDIDGGLNLSDLRLPDLPLVGPPFPPDQTLKLSFRLLAARGEFSQPDVSALNALLTTGPKLPNKAIQPGLDLYTSLQIGQERKEIDIPIGFNPQDGPGSAQLAGELRAGADMAPAFPPPETSNTGLAYRAVQPGVPAVRALSTANEQRSDDTKWFPVQKSFGPVHLERLGLAYKDNQITGAIDAALSAGGLTISLNGLSFTSPLNQLRPEFSLNGLGIEYRSDQIEIGGAFIKQSLKTREGTAYTGFGGLAVIRTKKLAIAAIGSYAKVNENPSLFIYAVVDYPIGGPPFFYVTGLAAGFGYNRALVVPDIDQIANFPLVQEAMRKGGPQKLPPDQARQQQALSAQLNTLERFIPPAVGQTFLAVGVHFTSFKMIDSFALLTVKFGERLEFNLLGISTLIAPAGESLSPMVAAKLALKATFIPDDGFFGAQAQLTSDSYIFSKSCHLTGGFAFFCWFKDNADKRIEGGDFALTLGGYHPHFNIPAHYPVVPRLGINWQVTPNLNIKGNAYFALTPHAIMAGGHLEILWHSGNLRAWFIANADFLVNWQPFHYDAHIQVNIGASYTFHCFGSHTVGIEIGADLHLWGPEFSGTAEIHCYLFSVRLAFGSGQAQQLAPISWDTFKQSFLPADDQVCSIALQDGLVRQVEADGKTSWVINPKDLSIATSSAIPSACQPSGELNVCIAPMGLRADHVSSCHQVKIFRIEPGGKETDVTGDFIRVPVLKSMPAALWGEPQMEGAYLKLPELNPEARLIGGLLAGYEIKAKPPKAGLQKAVQVDKSSGPLASVKDAYHWENLSAAADRGLNTWQRAADTIMDPSVRNCREEIVHTLGFSLNMLDFGENVMQDLYCEVNENDER